MSAAETSAEERIDDLVDAATSALEGEEVLLVAVQGEHSDFVRFNHALVRQAGSVEQMHADLDLSVGQRHTSMSLGLSGDHERDLASVRLAIEELRAQRAVVPDDPYFAFAGDVRSSRRTNGGDVPRADDLVSLVHDRAGGADFVGIWASGRQFSAFANSLGQRNWFAGTTFNLDWSLYLHGDKAAKEHYAGFDFSSEVFDRKLATQRAQLEVLARTPLELVPGEYRAWLAPSAVAELMDMLAWGGFGIRDHRATDSPLLKMATEDRRFSPMVTIEEDTAHGVAPNFGAEGFVRPDRVALITDGRYTGHLVSPRSAEEFGVEGNGANADEAPESVAMAKGSLDAANATAALDTGLLIGNLWYLNFSDRPNCRLTGMTRFATFWVEDGEIVAPVTAMRFDDSAFGLFGERLVGLGDTREVLLDPSSYGARSTQSARLPAMLVDDMKFTL